AVSIARRIQDPLAELVKIDPKSIGVGMYQHDVNQVELQSSLDAVVEEVVNAVGVDLNSASQALLARVAGIGPTLARRIVDHRNATGKLAGRAALKDVKGLGAKTFEQCAGFLRIRDGKEPLDATGIHPENYGLARAILKAGEARVGDEDLEGKLDDLKSRGVVDELAAKHDVGHLTLNDVLEALVKPGRDPREELDPPQLRSDVLSMEDLREGMQLKGTVRNVVDFGAFVDIGVKQDGLVHVSQMADRFVKNPYGVVSVGDQVDVVIMSIDKNRGRIGLSMKDAR
ncbi:MAG: helix-hairpin-helix domain-containing protein, partial [Bradymonadaceae bacterium]